MGNAPSTSPTGIVDVIPESILEGLSAEANATKETDLWKAWQIFLSQTTEGSPALLRLAFEIFQDATEVLRGIFDQTPQIMSWPTGLEVSLELRGVTLESIARFFMIMEIRKPRQASALILVGDDVPMWFELYRPTNKYLKIPVDELRTAIDEAQPRTSAAINERIQKVMKDSPFDREGFKLIASDRPLPLPEIESDGSMIGMDLEKPEWLSDQDGFFNAESVHEDGDPKVDMEAIVIEWLRHVLSKPYQKTPGDVDRYIMVSFSVPKHRNYLMIDRLENTATRVEPIGDPAVFDQRESDREADMVRIKLAEVSPTLRYVDRASMFSDLKRDFVCLEGSGSTSIIQRYPSPTISQWKDVQDFCASHSNGASKTFFLAPHEGNTVNLTVRVTKDPVVLTSAHWLQCFYSRSHPAMIAERIGHESAVRRIDSKELMGAIEATRKIEGMPENKIKILQEHLLVEGKSRTILVGPNRGNPTDEETPDWYRRSVTIVSDEDEGENLPAGLISQAWVEENKILSEPNPWLESMDQGLEVSVGSVQDYMFDQCRSDHPEVASPEVLFSIDHVQLDDKMCTMWSIYFGMLLALNPTATPSAIIQHIHDDDGSLKARMHSPPGAAEPKDVVHHLAMLRKSYRRVLVFVFCCLLLMDLKRETMWRRSILSKDALLEARMRLRDGLPVVSKGLVCLAETQRVWERMIDQSKMLIQDGGLVRGFGEEAATLADAVRPENTAATMEENKKLHPMRLMENMHKAAQEYLKRREAVLKVARRMSNYAGRVRKKLGEEAAREVEEEEEEELIEPRALLVSLKTMLRAGGASMSERREFNRLVRAAKRIG